MLSFDGGYCGNAYILLKILSEDEKARMTYEAHEAELMGQVDTNHAGVRDFP